MSSILQETDTRTALLAVKKFQVAMYQTARCQNSFKDYMLSCVPTAYLLKTSYFPHTACFCVRVNFAVSRHFSLHKYCLVYMRVLKLPFHLYAVK